MRIFRPWSVAIVVVSAAASCQVDEGYDFGDPASGGAEAGSGQDETGDAGSGAETQAGSGGARPSTGGRNSSGPAGSAGEAESPGGGSPAAGGSGSGGEGMATGGQPQGEGGSTEATGGTGTGGVPPLPSQPGAACEDDAECESDVCFDGVCCEEACAGTCYGCTRMRTNQPNGVCAPVIAGSDPYDSCAKSDDACGLDGLCDGDGACRYPDATSVCAAASCIDGQLTAASQCSGDGDCVAPAATSCGDYACANGSSCRTSCSSNSHCSASTYCKGSSCADKEQPGVVCSAAAECESGTCSGRCCASGTPCNCPQPSAGNLVKNPGFDADLSSWNFSTAHTWQAVDASEPGATAQCPYSGSMAVTTTSVPFSQCVSVQEDTFYNFGVRIRIQGEVDSAQCNVILWSQNDCKGENVLAQSVEVTSVSNNFSGDLSKSFNSGGYVSVEIYCFTLAWGTAVGSFDRFYLSKPPGGF
jgi:hypothetical protein